MTGKEHNEKGPLCQSDKTISLTALRLHFNLSQRGMRIKHPTRHFLSSSPFREDGIGPDRIRSLPFPYDPGRSSVIPELAGASGGRGQDGAGLKSLDKQDGAP